MRIFPALLAALLAALPLSGAAAPFSVRLGTERIALDALPGFTDTMDLASPRLLDVAASLTAPSNRVLLFALTDGDLRRFQNGDPLDPKKRYMMVTTPKGLERDRVTAELFKALVTDSVRDLGKPEQVDDVIKFLEARPIGLTSLLAELRRDPTAVTVMQATRLEPLPGARIFERSTPQYLLLTTTFILARGKALIATVYTLYFDPSDMDWLKVATQRWVEDLQRLNR